MVGTQTALWFWGRNEKGFTESTQESKIGRALVGVGGFFSVVLASLYWIAHDLQLSTSDGGSWIVRSEPQVVLILLTFVFAAMYVIGVVLSEKKKRAVEMQPPVYLDYRGFAETRLTGPFELRYCPNCGRDVSNLMARFCSSCGMALVSQSASHSDARCQIDDQQEMSGRPQDGKQATRKLKVQ